jgi:hypothetical protein
MNFMAFLQKVSFCNLTRKDPRFFFTGKWKKIGIAVRSLIVILLKNSIKSEEVREAEQCQTLPTIPLLLPL